MGTGQFGYGLARSRFVYHSSVSIYRTISVHIFDIKGMSKNVYCLYSGNAKEM